MIAVGIDIPKAKSTVAVIDSDGTVLASPFTMAHTQPEMEAFVTYLKGLGEPTTILMEYTGHYHLLSRVYHISQRKNIFIYENLTVLLRTEPRSAKSPMRDTLTARTWGLIYTCPIRYFIITR